jgi:hypothetical protein
MREEERKSIIKISIINFRSTCPSLRVGLHWKDTFPRWIYPLCLGTLVGGVRKKRVIGGAQEDSAC